MTLVLRMILACMAGLLTVVCFSVPLFAQQDTTRNDYFWLFSDSIGIDWTNPKQPRVFTAPIFDNTGSVSNWSFKHDSVYDCIFTTNVSATQPADSMRFQIKTLRGNKQFTTWVRGLEGGNNGRMIYNLKNDPKSFGLLFRGFHKGESRKDTFRRAVMFMLLKLDQDFQVDSMKCDDSRVNSFNIRFTYNARLFGMPSYFLNKSHDNKRFLFPSHNDVSNDFLIQEDVSNTAYDIISLGTEILPFGTSPKQVPAQMVMNHQGTQLAVISLNGFVEVFDFDRCSQNIRFYAYYGRDSLFSTFPQQNHQDRFITGAFSPDGTKLYVCTQDSVFQFDLLSDLNLKDKKFVAGFPSNHPERFTDMKLAPDGKIYLTQVNNQLSRPTNDAYLAVIAFPDSHVTRCGFSTKGLNMGKRKIGNSFPNIADNGIKPLKLTDVAKICPYRTVVVCPNTAVRLKGRYGRLSVNSNDLNAHRIEGSNDFYFKTSKPGTYHYSKSVAIKGNPCWNDTMYSEKLTIIVRPDVQEPCLAVSRPETEIEEPIKVYPNPASDQIKVKSYTQETFEMSIYNQTGTKLMSLPVNQSGEVSVSTAELPAGIYLLQARGRNGILFNQKLVITH